MKLKYLAAASLLALVSAGAQAASTLSGPGVSLVHGNSGAVPHSVGNFSDSWSLVVDEATGFADIGISVTDVEFTFAGLTFEIDNLGISTTTQPFDGADDSWSFSDVLANGTYNITVGGIASGSLGGTYNVGFTAVPTAAPVPLPPAALLFGSALIGLAAMRRKKAAKELVEA